jgi:ParB/RepB/Spo0J family partition protein
MVREYKRGLKPMDQPSEKEGELRRVPLASIVVGDHEVRGAEDDPELASLAANIAENGLLEPLIVEDREGVLHLVAGHRRWSACNLARIPVVNVVVRKGSVQEMKRISWAENFHRKDLSAVQQARAIADVVADGTITIAEVAATFRRSVEWVKDQLEILSWPEDVQAAVHSRKLNVSAASNLAQIADPTYRAFLLQTAVNDGATARTTAGWLQGWQAQLPAGQVVLQEAPAGPPGAGPVLPLSLCLGCRGEFSPAGLCPVFVCPTCVSHLREGRLAGGNR